MNKRGFSRKEKFLIVLAFIILVTAIYFTFFFYYKCNTLACFNSHLEKCSRTKFIKDAEDVAWLYKIEGKKGGDCKIYAEIKQVKQGKFGVEKLEGDSMTCYLPYGVVAAPESDISKCHGLLKEQLQDVIIQKMHSYIVSQIGEIGEELKKAV